jgi:monoamine oxidase
VTILEATNRTGGRIRSVVAYQDHRSQLGHLEMGAQWIHGEIGNVAFKLANESGLVDTHANSDDDWPEHFVTDQGKIMIKNYAKKFERFQDSSEDIDDIEDQLKTPGLSVGHYYDSKASIIAKE